VVIAPLIVVVFVLRPTGITAILDARVVGKQADDLCYWERERAELDRMILGTEEPVPTCVFWPAPRLRPACARTRAIPRR
jgi:hypothetical protein